MNVISKTLVASALLLSACSGSGGADAADAASAPDDAACGRSVDVYASIGGEQVIASYDGSEVITVWRTEDGLVYVVRADKNGACIEHVGRAIQRIPL